MDAQPGDPLLDVAVLTLEDEALAGPVLRGLGLPADPATALLLDRYRLLRRRAGGRQAGAAAGLMLAFRRKTLSGSYLAFSRARRSYFAGPYEARTRSSSYSAMKFT